MFKSLKILISIILCLGLTFMAGLASFADSKGHNEDKNWKNTEKEHKYIEKNKSNNGLKGEYYNNTNFKKLSFTRIDSRISFDWEAGSPGPGLGNDAFSIRWTGQIQPRYTDTYTFHAIADDGVRLWINNKLVIDDWSGHAATESDGAISLEANKKYNIRLDYYENKNDACVKLLWSSSRQVKEIIPKDRLISETNSTIHPTPTASPTATPPPATPPADDRQAVKADLSAYFNEDAFSYDTKRSDGDYDGSGDSYSANLVTANPVYDGTAYLTGPFRDGRNNSVRLEGQTIGVKQNKYESIRLLGSSTNGDKSGTVRINYTDGTYGWFTLSMKDWCTSDTTGEKNVQTLSHRHSSIGDDNTGNYIFAYYLSPDKSKKVSSITMPDENDMHVLAITLLPNVQTWSGTGNGLNGEYFDNMNLTSPKLNRIDTTVNFDWGLGAPSSKIESDTFSVRWTGKVEPKYSETYTFHTVSDDGVRLWVNNVLLIDDWNDHAASERSGAITLSAGTKYNIRLEYYENLENASVKLMWSSPSQSKEIIPASQLYH